MKKILYIPLDYHRHKEDDMLFGSMLRALQKQTDAIIYDNIDDAIKFQPDIVLFQGSVLSEDLLHIKHHTQAKFIMWTGDIRYAPTGSLWDYQAIIDFYLLPASGAILRRYRSLLDRPCHFIWEPIQDWRFKKPKEMQGGKIVFVGNGYEALPGGEKRAELISFLKKHIPEFEVYGSIEQSGGPIENKDVPELYNNSYLVIAENNWDDIDDYFTPRNTGAMAAGSCCLMREFPGIDKYFSNYNNCIYYRHKYELLDIINFLKMRPDIRNVIAHSAYHTAQFNYTMDKWVTQFLSIT